MRRLLPLLTTSLVLAGSAVAQAAVAPGRVVLPNGNPAPVDNVDAGGAGAAVALPDGGVVLAGQRHGGGFVLTRLRADGTVDPSFGQRGTATVVAPGLGLRDMLRQGDGRLVLVAQRNAPDPRFQAQRTTLLRLTADGRPDAGFGRGGVVDTEVQNGAAALQDDGAIVLTGASGRFETSRSDPANIRGQRWIAARLTPSGAPDASFGGDGSIDVPGVATDHSAGYDLDVGPGGRIVLSGHSENRGALVALDPSGALDPGFGGGRPVAVGDAAFDVDVRPSGVVDVLHLDRLTRFTAAGAGDVTFGDGGVVALGRTGLGWHLTPTPDGGALVTRQSYEPVLASAPAMHVRRIRPDGRLAETFGLSPAFGGGLGSSPSRAGRLRGGPLEPRNSFSGRLLRRPDGSYLAIGGVRVVQYTGEGEGFSSGHFAVAAFTPLLTPDRRFGGPPARARLSVAVPRQRARAGALLRRPRVLVRVHASGPGLLLLRVRDGRRRILAQSYLPVHAAGSTTARVPLTTTGRRILRRGGRRVTVGHAFRDLLTATDQGSLTATLR